MTNKKKKRMQNQIIIEKMTDDPAILDHKIIQITDWIFASQNQEYSWNINIIFVNDDFIIELNKKYFQKDYATDVISFNLTELKESPEGEIYICVQTAIENAKHFQSTPKEEILRLVAHGVYHLLDYGDATAAEKELMTELENSALASIHQQNQESTGGV